MKKVILLLAVMFSMNAAAQVKQRKDVTLFYKFPFTFVQALEAKYNTKVQYALEDEVVVPATAGDLLIEAAQWKNASYGFAAAGIVGFNAVIQGDPQAANGVIIAGGLASIVCSVRGNYLIARAGRQLNKESK